MNSEKDVVGIAETRVAQLMHEGLVTGIGVARGDGQEKIFVAVSAQVNPHAPDFDSSKIESTRARLKAALRDIPFQILGDYNLTPHRQACDEAPVIAPELEVSSPVQSVLRSPRSFADALTCSVEDGANKSSRPPVTDQESQRRDLPFDEKPLDLMSPAPAMAEALANDSGFFRSPQGASVDHELDSAACAEADAAASPAGEAGQAQRKSRDWLMLVASKDANAIAAERPNRAGVQTPHEYPVSVDASVAGAQRARISPFGALAAASTVMLVGMGLYYFATDPARHNPRHQSAGIPDTRAPFDLATAEKARSDDHGTTLGREAIVGVSEVIDTGTLRISGKVVSLFGVQWVRGGQATDLAEYLRGRQVTCRPAPVTGTYRCYVEGRDLSQVVLFNGGGRATPEATPDLVAAEGHARAQRLGVWHK